MLVSLRHNRCSQVSDGLHIFHAGFHSFQCLQYHVLAAAQTVSTK